MQGAAPLDRLYERPGLLFHGLPAGLADLYGGDLGFAAPRLYANFVASLDGVVALPAGGESGQIISGGSRADRFVMALLRACADAILVGAGTFRATPGHVWHAETVYPEAAPLFAELRSKLRLRPHPPLVLVTASGEIDVTQPALGDALVVTGDEGSQRLRGRLPPGARVLAVDLGPGPLRLSAVVERLRAEGFRQLLTEGGPLLAAQLVAERLLDELFLTSAPVLFGTTPADGRRSLMSGLDLGGQWLELLSARRHESHLFLRYAIRRVA